MWGPPLKHPVRVDIIGRYLTFEYLPRTEANLALTNIRVQHPAADRAVHANLDGTMLNDTHTPTSNPASTLCVTSAGQSGRTRSSPTSHGSAITARASQSRASRGRASSRDPP